MFTTPDRAVVAVHQDNDGWALIITASRKQNGRRLITPNIIAREDGDHNPFATCPRTLAWTRDGGVILLKYQQHLKEAQLEERLHNTVVEFLAEIHKTARVLETAQVGWLSGLRYGHQEALANFEMGAEPAFHWLCSEAGDKSGKAEDCLRLCRHLAEKHGLHELTHGELAAAAERRIVNQRGWR